MMQCTRPSPTHADQMCLHSEINLPAHSMRRLAGVYSQYQIMYHIIIGSCTDREVGLELQFAHSIDLGESSTDWIYVQIYWS